MSKANNTKFLMVDSHLREGDYEELNIKELFHKYFWSKWYLYVLSCLVFGGLAYAYLKKQQPVYEISSKLLIKERDNDYSSPDDWVKRNLKFSVISENVANEIEVLSSYSIMYDVVSDLGLDVRYYWKHNLSTYDRYKDFPISVEYYELNPLEKTSFEIRPVDDTSFKFLQDEEGGLYTYGEEFTNQFGRFCIERTEDIHVGSDSIMNVEFIHLKALAESYLTSLRVAFSDNKSMTSILRLTLEDIIPERGVDILEAVIQKYHRIKFEESNAIAVNTLKLLNDRIVDISQELRVVENSMEQYKVNNQAFQSTADLNILLQSMNTLTQEQNDLEVQLNIVHSMKKGLGNGTGEYELIPINLSLINDQIQQLIQPYNDLVLKRKQLLLTGQPSNPIVQAVNQDLANLKPSIFAALDNMQKDLQMKLDTATNQLAGLQQRLKSKPRNERILSDRTRDREITEDLYVYLLKKKEETNLALVNSFSKSNVVDPPRSTLDPIGPSGMKIYAAGLMAGFVFPFFFVFLFEMIRDSVQTEDEVKKLIPEANIMGMICQNKNKERQVVLRQRRTLVAENFRVLRTKLQFHFRSRKKCIMVTSSTSSEGKTFVSMNLAMSFALAKKKTVIIDFDMHKPDLMKYMEELPENGLSDFLTAASTIEEVIQKSDISPMLDYIPSGPLPLNPNEIITESKLDELFEHLKSHYDIIIVDTPPIGIISDAMLLNKYLTNSLYVIRSGFTKKSMLEKAEGLMENKMLVNPALVLNGVRKTNLYGYGYSKYSKYAV